MVLKTDHISNAFLVLRVLRALRGDSVFSRRFSNLRSGAEKFAQAEKPFKHRSTKATRIHSFYTFELRALRDLRGKCSSTLNPEEGR